MFNQLYPRACARPSLDVPDATVAGEAISQPASWAQARISPQGFMSCHKLELCGEIATETPINQSNAGYGWWASRHSDKNNQLSSTNRSNTEHDRKETRNEHKVMQNVPNEKCEMTIKIPNRDKNEHKVAEWPERASKWKLIIFYVSLSLCLLPSSVLRVRGLLHICAQGARSLPIHPSMQAASCHKPARNLSESCKISTVITRVDYQGGHFT